MSEEYETVWSGDMWRTAPAIGYTLPDESALCHQRRNLYPLLAQLLAALSDDWQDTRALRAAAGLDVHTTASLMHQLLRRQQVERRQVAARSGRGMRFVFRRVPVRHEEGR